MEIHTVRGGTKEEFCNGEYNLAVPISLGNRWFTEQSVLELVQFSLPYAKEFLVVYVADTIHAVNIEVRNRRSRNGALRKAKRMGREFLLSVQQTLSANLHVTEKDKVFYKNWDDLLTDDYLKKQKFLYDKYKKDSDFRREIKRLVKNTTSMEEKGFSEEEIEKLGNYIIEELPELLMRVPIDGLQFDANVYPFDNDLLVLVEDIQKGRKFPEIAKEMIDSKNKVFVEVR